MAALQKKEFKKKEENKPQKKREVGLEGRERVKSKSVTEKCSSVSKLALCNAEGLIRSRGMYQPLRGIYENFSFICRASLKIPLVLRWR